MNRIFEYAVRFFGVLKGDSNNIRCDLEYQLILDEKDEHSIGQQRQQVHSKDHNNVDRIFFQHYVLEIRKKLSIAATDV